jgi:hypothetical protein
LFGFHSIVHWDNLFLQDSKLTTNATGKLCYIWGRKSTKNLRKDCRTMTHIIMTVHRHRLTYYCSNIWSLRMWLSPFLLTWLVWPWVIYCFREWNHSYDSTVFRMLLKFKNSCWPLYPLIQNVSFCSASTEAETLYLPH